MKALLPTLVLGTPVGAGLPDRVTVGVVDHRRFPRVTFRVSALLEDDDGEVEALTRDISLGGIFIEPLLPTPFRFGQRVFLWLRFPGHKLETPLPATVRWSDAGGLGLQFHSTGARETHAITEIVATASLQNLHRDTERR